MPRLRPDRFSFQPQRFGKPFDLMLLAGCSCLLTIVTHPSATALQTPSTGSSQAAIATQVRGMSQNWAGMLRLTLPPKRDDLEDDE